MEGAGKLPHEVPDPGEDLVLSSSQPLLDGSICRNADGQWQPMKFQLINDSVAAFSAESGQMVACESYQLAGLSDVNWDQARRECSFQTGTSKVRLRTSGNQEAWKCFEALQRRSEKNVVAEVDGSWDVWLQIDRVSALRCNGRTGNASYVIRARWLGNEDEDEVIGTEPRQAVPGAKTGTEDCVVRQQVLLKGATGPAVAQVTVLRLGTDGDAPAEEVVGRLDVKTMDRKNHEGKGREQVLRDHEGGPTGALIKVRCKPNQPPKVAADFCPENLPAAPPSPVRAPTEARAPPTPQEAPQSPPAEAASDLPAAVAAPAEPEAPPEDSRAPEAVQAPAEEETASAEAPLVQLAPQQAPAEQQAVPAMQLRVWSPAGAPAEDSTQRSSSGCLSDCGLSLADEAPVSSLQAVSPKRIRTSWPSPSLPPSPRSKARAASPAREPRVSKPKVGPKQALDAIQAIMNEYHLSVSQVFRSQELNSAYIEKGQTNFTGADVRAVLSKAGVEVSFIEARAIVRYLDQDSNDMLSTEELEAALRGHRLGLEVWEPRPTSRSPSPLARNGVVEVPARVESLYKSAEEKQRKLAEKKAEMEDREMMKLEADAVKARPMRQKIIESGIDPTASAKRLYDDHQAALERRQHLQQQHKDKEDQEIERLRNSSRSKSPAGPPHGEDLLTRCEKWKAGRDARIQALQEQKAKDEVAEVNKLGIESAKRAAERKDDVEREPAFERMFADAEKKRKMLEAKRDEKLAKEKDEIASSMIGKGKPLNKSRIEELHKEHEVRQKRREDIEKQDVAKALEQAGKVHAAAAKDRNSSEVQAVWSRLTSAPQHQKKDPKKQVEAEKPEKKTWSPVEPVHHVLASVNTAVSARTGSSPEAVGAKDLAVLGASLKEALLAFRDAQQKSDSSEGLGQIKNVKNYRLYSDGHLLAEADGQARCNQPDPISQLVDDPDKLSELADHAQLALLRSMVSDPTADLSESWPAGSTLDLTGSETRAMFAYNPGPKAAAAVAVKSAVQYGPAQSGKRWRHVVDLARVSLVYANPNSLKAGLEKIMDLFEVVEVRNFYANQNLLGERFISVLVALKEALGVRVASDVPPVVCEIRLEEVIFFNARKAAEPHLAKVASGFSSLYQRPGLDADCVEYYASWVLRRPKELHSLTVFRRQLTRRYGSTVAAWRKACGTSGTRMSFYNFRDLCGTLLAREHTVEYWQAMDSTRAGCVSLFEFDQEATLLLAKLYGRMLLHLKDHLPCSTEEMFALLAQKANVKLGRSSQMVMTEFRAVCKSMGFGQVEAERLFAALDANAGVNAQPPLNICVADLAWFKRLPSFVDVPFMILGKSGSTDQDLTAWSVRDAGARQRNPLAASQALRQSITEEFVGDKMAALAGLADNSARESVKTSRGSGSGGQASESSAAPAEADLLEADAEPASTTAEAPAEHASGTVENAESVSQGQAATGAPAAPPAAEAESTTGAASEGAASSAPKAAETLGDAGETF